MKWVVGFRVQGCGGGFAANIYGVMPEGLRVAGQNPAAKNIWLPIQASLSSQKFFLCWFVKHMLHRA